MEEDLQLAELVIKRNLMDREQLVACMREQALGGDPPKPLGQIMVEKGLISESQLTELSEEVTRSVAAKSGGATTLYCHNCDAVYRVKVKAGSRYRCKQCSTPLSDTPKSASPESPSEPVAQESTPTASEPSPANPATESFATNITDEIAKALAEMESQANKPSVSSDIQVVGIRENLEGGVRETPAPRQTTPPPRTPPPRDPSTRIPAPPPETAGVTEDPDWPEDVKEANREVDNRLGDFILVKPLGRGSMGEVWKAFDKNNHRYVAIKILAGHMEDDMRRFKREAEVGLKLKHKNICSIYDINQVEGKTFIVMQYINGENLRLKRLGLRQAMKAAGQVAAALQYAHEQGYVHRDIKPGNLMMDEDGEVYITDFGLARPMSATLRLKRAGEGIFGTPGFMSPEQAMGRTDDVDGRSDTFSLGATLYFMVTGEDPFTAKDSLGMIRKIIEEDPESPGKLLPDSNIPPEVDRIIMKALSKDKEKRYQRASDMSKDIEQWLRGAPVSLDKAVVPQGLSRRKSGRKWGLIVVAMLLAVFSVGGYLVYETYIRPGMNNTNVDGREKELAEKEVNDNFNQAQPLWTAFEDLSYKETPISFNDRVGGLEEIEKKARRIIEVGEKFQLAYHGYRLQARCLTGREKFEEAYQEYAKAIQAAPDRDGAMYAEQARLSLRALQVSFRLSPLEGKTASAWAQRTLSSAEEAMRMSGKTPLLSAMTLFAQGKDADCVGECERALLNEKNSRVIADLASILGDAELRLNNSEKAAAAYQRCVESRRSDDLAYFAAGWARLESVRSGRTAGSEPIKELDKAIEELSTGMKLRPDLGWWTYVRGLCHEAKAKALRAAKQDPEASLQAAFKDFEAFLQTPLGAKFAAQINGMMGSSYLESALFRLETDQDPLPEASKAVEYTGKALEANPQDAGLFVQRGTAHRIRGEAQLRSNQLQPAREDFNKALEDFDKAIAINRSTPSYIEKGMINIRLARYFIGIKDLMRAEKHFKDALEEFGIVLLRDPNHFEVLLESGFANLERAKLNQLPAEPPQELNSARDAFNRAARINAKDARPFQGRGWVYQIRAKFLISQGRIPIEELEQARSDLKTAVELDAALKNELEPDLKSIEEQLKALQNPEQPSEPPK